MEQKEGYFEELKQIYNINIPIPKPSVTIDNHVQKFLFYIDLTNNQTYSDTSFQLSINNNIQRTWQGGFLSEFLFNNKKKEQQSIFCYYFNKLIEKDEQINIQNLFRFRIFLQEFISTQKNYQVKFVIHFTQNNDDQKKFEDNIVKLIYQILDGSFDKLQDIICVYNKKEIQQINYCKISSKKIHFNKSKQSDRFDLSFFVVLDEFLTYFQFKQNDPNQIGFICFQYVQRQVNVVLKEYEKELKHLQKDISLMIQFPVNLNNEIEINYNVAQYLKNLKNIIGEIYMAMKDILEFDQMAKELYKILSNQRSEMIQQLSGIVNQNSQFEIYLRLLEKNKSPNEVFNQLLQFKFELLESDIQVLKKLKTFYYNQDTLNATLFRVILDTKQWFKQFNKYFPQSLAYMKRILPQKQNLNVDKPCVFVLGMTRVGKSTLLNILSNPENIIVNQNKKFDVKEKDNRILLSHSNNSQTFQMEHLEIDKFTFFDSPGQRDTNESNRWLNLFNIFNQITRVRQQIVLLMIDGDQLLEKKTDFLDSIDQINLMLGNQRDDKCLENLIIPVFTKIKNDSTMEQIIQKWQSDTMKDITDQSQLKILNIIKKAIDNQNYQKIYDAETYQIQSQNQQLKQEIINLKDIALKFLGEGKFKEGQEIYTEIKVKDEELKNLQQENLIQENFLEKIKKIKDDILEKCQRILNMQKNNVQSLNFKFKLTPELQGHLDKLLPHRNKFYQHILNIITNDFVAKMLYDDSISIQDKFSEICEIDHIILKKLVDIPKLHISRDIQYQIDELNNFNKTISKYNKENKDPQKVRFDEFKLQLSHLYKAFTEVVPIFCDLFQLLYQGWKGINQQEDNIVQQGIGLVLATVVSIPVIVLSGVNNLFANNLFVTEQEKEKIKKLNLIKIQQAYYKNLQKSK